jgi:hypothetical protein
MYAAVYHLADDGTLKRIGDPTTPRAALVELLDLEWKSKHQHFTIRYRADRDALTEEMDPEAGQQAEPTEQ